MTKQAAIGSSARTREILARYQIRAKKGYGQNFLTNPAVLTGIVAAAKITKADNVLEIGPGIGALTEQLAQAAGEVVALEIDESLLPVLAEVLAPYDNVTVKHQDVLKANLKTLVQTAFQDPTKPVKVVANLPYYITSPIILALLASQVPWQGICVMMQKEVADRLVAQPGTKEYGALTLAIEAQMDAHLAFTVSRHSFMPVPRVDSAIVTLTPRQQPLAVAPFDQNKLSHFIRTCFAHRRKSLWNNLKTYTGKDPVKQDQVKAILAALQIDPQVRPERLTLTQFIQLANHFHADGLI